MSLENFLKQNLNFQNVKATNQFGGGCISQGQTFIVDDNKKIFVKQNSEAIVSCSLTNHKTPPEIHTYFFKRPK